MYVRVGLHEGVSSSVGGAWLCPGLEGRRVTAEQGPLPDEPLFHSGLVSWHSHTTAKISA